MIKATLVTLAIGYLINYFGIKALKKLNFRQNIREDGPSSHLKKYGTPTMGGIFIIATVLLSMLITMQIVDTKIIIIIISFIGFGSVGLLDDLLKKLRGKNLGLRSWQKMLGILIISLFIISYMLKSGEYNNLHPFFLMFNLNNPLLFFLFGFTVLAGTSNGVNLTDGLDGLAAGTSAIIFVAFAFLNFNIGNHSISYFCILIAAALMAFLWFNHHPAQVFMGDVGSLAIGGTLGTIALLTHTELNLFFCGFIFVIETMSVIMQVISFKLTKKRIFKMSPIHHHFELSGWVETKVVTRFWLTSIVFSLIGLLV
ncbi:MAG: phospho-N-acetylmuramoyl-pentapeptide-transferase [Candidatus Margulisiibacteriota bacterium]|nr:MAG: phospho-N-acetylmuramoyl-pentapeptide-transferase [Candidatus Margulisbacteria bacterium GWD2_39_127]OGI02958.1 MAG: phospho-N-acetylmuramoyl-pentapeptide-transferase [Candidatus Margulisbacteria bacterium GWF2_38_17]OGI09449.1 MAG: phospho-N-acetylmuramoyl-pentapeptide-transferase [Candidatus Margulisbacteria bacterium GWE2_39_32]PZM78751.1 MAG: phospho-N-acetylmuramoyl-pentapeptide-transferase [Candidatus Margulisiibacteriota bacterium]HAR63347.1 phospho-N-acetylmuramoyl-pentapeptide-